MKRCEVINCKIKQNVFKIKCDCGGIFCNKHMFFQEHNCVFDYKTKFEKTNAKNNPKIAGTKITKI